MHVFLTGATGFIGSVVVTELIAAGHTVTGLSRSPAKAVALAATGATVLHGTLDDLDLLRDAAAAADGVIHTAFSHDDFTQFAANGVQDRRAIEAMGAAVVGTTKPFLVTSGVALLSPGRVATEDDAAPAGGHPRQSEVAAAALAAEGVRVSVIRLAPSVHGAGEKGFVPILIGLARRTGVAAYIGDGVNRWPAAYRDDAARLYVRALEHDGAGRTWHGIAEEGIAFRDIAAVIGRRLGVPVEPRDPDHFGWFAGFAGADIPASNAITRAALDWPRTGPGLLADIDQDAYFGG